MAKPSSAKPTTPEALLKIEDFNGEILPLGLFNYTSGLLKIEDFNGLTFFISYYFYIELVIFTRPLIGSILRNIQYSWTQTR